MLPLAEIAFLAPSGAAPMLAESGPDLSRALGRLHPLMVHFPIALALVAIGAEWWRSLARQQGLSALTRPLLWIAALSAVFATTSGWVNAAHEHAGSDSATLNLHRWIGTGTTVFLVLLAVWSSAVQAMIARASSEAVAQLGAFRWVALMGGVAVGVTGHLGGELVHGEGYLSKVLLPAAEKRELEPKTEAPVQEIALSPDETFFLEKVRPILEVHCFECHGSRKQKGGLRMDTKAWLFGPDESKWTVVPGIPEESDLLQRVLLERDDPDAMPPEGSGLTADEITVLRTWIEKGAAFPERAASGVPGLNVSAASTALATLGTVAIAGGSTVEIPEDVRKRGMGTTIVGVLFTNNGAYVGHCGDSRAYRFRNNTLEQITDDHSLLNDYLKNHKLTPEEIEAFPHKNVIVRALGMKDSVQVDVSRLEPLPNDVYLICSDGLSGMVRDDELHATIHDWQSDPARAEDIDGLCRTLIDAANRNGGTDNVTCVLMKVQP